MGQLPEHDRTLREAKRYHQYTPQTIEASTLSSGGGTTQPSFAYLFSKKYAGETIPGVPFESKETIRSRT
jgi:hypothetical protein